MADRFQAAINRLVCKGIRVTVRAVRDEAGGGSHRDVAHVVRRWREAREASEGLPAEVLDAIDTLLKWRDLLHPQQPPKKPRKKGTR